MEGPPGDETLLLAVTERDMAAFRALYERHAGWPIRNHPAFGRIPCDQLRHHGNHERVAADDGEDQVDGAHMPSVSPVAAEEIGGRPQRGVAASLTPVRWLTPWAPGSLRPSVRSIRAATRAWPFSGPARTGLRSLARSEPT